MTCKQSRPRSDCSWRNSQIRVYIVIPLRILRNLHKKQNLGQNSMEYSVWNFRTFTITSVHMSKVRNCSLKYGPSKDSDKPVHSDQWLHASVMLSMPGIKKSQQSAFWNIFIFPRKRSFTFYANCLLRQYEWNVTLFSGKNKKNFINSLSGSLPSVLKINP